MNCTCTYTYAYCYIVAGDPMSTKPVGHHHPPATQQNFGGNFERSSDRLAPSNKKITVDHSRAAVGGDGNLSGLSQRLVKFVWYPNDPFKVHEQKATLLSSFTVSYLQSFHVLNYDVQ